MPPFPVHDGELPPVNSKSVNVFFFHVPGSSFSTDLLANLPSAPSKTSFPPQSPIPPQTKFVLKNQWFSFILHVYWMLGKRQITKIVENKIEKSKGQFGAFYPLLKSQSNNFIIATSANNIPAHFHLIKHPSFKAINRLENDQQKRRWRQSS